MDIKIILSITATSIGIISYIPYFKDTLSGKTKPHAFSWFIWALLGYIAGFAQIAGGGGIGALVVLTTATISLAISLLSLKKLGMQFVTKSDWVGLIVALLTIPLWIITKGPLVSVILISIIDMVGFWPTIRKAYSYPYDETMSTYVLSTVKHCLTVLAQQKYTLVTILYPASLAVLTGVFVVELLLRRSHISTSLRRNL